MFMIETIMKTIGLFCLMNECTSFLIFTPLTLNKSIFPSIFSPELNARSIVEDTATLGDQENNFGDEPGVLPPVGFWDPLKITNNVDVNELYYYSKFICQLIIDCNNEDEYKKKIPVYLFRKKTT